ncbi:hypothetical protein FB451DRAFT_1374198 [Mycena latifolia]|nr:hypothetical protein FB451DRAFT_1374198 [Mycena latifolia]
MSDSDRLPPHGFGPETAFKILAEQNPFLFRVYTPRVTPRSEPPFTALPDPAFTAPAFDRRFTADAGSPSSNPPHPTYADAARHLDWTTRHASPYVSASFSLMWAVWEALRRYHFNVKYRVEIAVIDASASELAQRAATIVELLQSVPATERHASHWRWYRAAHASQSVLVYGAIPAHCILASVPLLRVLDSLPYSYLRPRLTPELKPPMPTPIQRVSWTYAGPRASYRRFCEEEARSLLRASPEEAVRLALALLGAWFAWMMRLRAPPGLEDYPDVFRDAAVTKVCELSRAIALWPAPDTPDTLGNESRALWDELRRLVREEASRIPRAAISSENHKRSRRPPAPADSDSDSDADFGANRKFKKVDAPTPIRAVQDPWTSFPTPPPTPPPAQRAPPPGPSSQVARSDPEPKHEHVHKLMLKAEVEESARGDADCAPRTAPPVDDALESAAMDDVADSLPPPKLASAHPTSDPPDLHSMATEFCSMTPDFHSMGQTAVHAHSLSETASALLAGFFFGALIVVVLSAQRRPALLLVS